MKSIFTSKQLLLCCTLAFFLGACAPDDAEIVPTPSAAQLSATSTKGGGGGTGDGVGSKDDDVGSLRYLLLTDAEASADLSAEITLAGGTLEETKASLGLVIARSKSAGFATNAAKIKGVRSVLRQN